MVTSQTPVHYWTDVPAAPPLLQLSLLERAPQETAPWPFRPLAK